MKQLFIVFFLCWQLHGMFCACALLASPDRVVGLILDHRHDPARPSTLLLSQHHRRVLGEWHAACFPYMSWDSWASLRWQKYWLLGGVVWISERILREVRGES
jgi:hypothetical protein